jgi:hypothetical protein
VTVKVFVPVLAVSIADPFATVPVQLATPEVASLHAKTARIEAPS